MVGCLASQPALAHLSVLDRGQALLTHSLLSYCLSPSLRTAGGTLDGSPIQVSSEELTDDHPSVHGDAHDHDDIPQEAKPRTAIVAEYLASGYVLSEPIINRAVAFDQKHGISSRFLEFFRNLTEQTKQKSAEIDAQTQISQKAGQAYAQADEKAGVTEKAKSAFAIGKSCACPFAT